MLVIAPFGGWNDRYYTEVYRPAVEAAGLDPKRADDIYRPSAIVHDIWAYVKTSRVMLADLTGKNPNVFYELGLAHAVGKPVIMVTQSMEDVPFDLRALRVIEYDVENPEWGQVLREKIGRALGEVLAAPEQAVPPTFLRERKIESQPSVTPLQRRILALEQQIDLLRAETRSRLLVQPPERVSGPEEAEALISRYLAGGMPDGAIIDRLSRGGVPVSFVQRAIGKYRSKTEGQKPEREVVPTPATEGKKADEQPKS